MEGIGVLFGKAWRILAELVERRHREFNGDVSQKPRVGVDLLKERGNGGEESPPLPGQQIVKPEVVFGIKNLRGLGMYSLVHSEDGNVHPLSSIEAHCSVVVAPVAELEVEFQGDIEDEEFGVDLKARL